MRTWFVYLQLELKRTIKSIPYVFTGAIVLVVLAGTIAFSAANLLYRERAVGRIQVGVVVPEDDVLVEKLMQMIESLDSVESLCAFSYLEWEEGIAGLEDGTYFALLTIPEGMVESILNGANIPAQVVFPERSGLEAAVFRELTEAGASILGTSQAGIYAADEYLIQHGLSVLIPDVEADLNRIFLSYALDRDVYFRRETVTAADGVGIGAHFAISGVVIMMLFMGIPMAPVLRPSASVFRQKLSRSGVSGWMQTGVRFVCAAFVQVLVSVVWFGFCIWAGFLEFRLDVVMMYLLVLLVSAGWILMFYELCRNTVAAMLFLFVTTVAMMFCSGGILPSVFLPESLQAVGQWLPASFLMDGIRSMIVGNQGAAAGKLLATLAASLFISAAAGGRE